MDKRETYNLTKKLISELRRIPKRKIIFKKLSGNDYGEMHYTINNHRNGEEKTEKIVIDHTKGEILETLVHELLHSLGFKPRSVPKIETEWIKNSSWFQKKQLLTELVKKK